MTQTLSVITNVIGNWLILYVLAMKITFVADMALINPNLLTQVLLAYFYNNAEARNLKMSLGEIGFNSFFVHKFIVCITV